MRAGAEKEPQGGHGGKKRKPEKASLQTNPMTFLTGLLERKDLNGAKAFVISLVINLAQEVLEGKPSEESLKKFCLDFHYWWVVPGAKLEGKTIEDFFGERPEYDEVFSLLLEKCFNWDSQISADEKAATMAAIIALGNQWLDENGG